MSPTPEQLARAAELAPKVAASQGWKFYSASTVWICLPGPPRPEKVIDLPTKLGLLDPRAFQAVLLALDAELVWEIEDRIWEEASEDAPMISLLGALLTPSGMLAFYEALISK